MRTRVQSQKRLPVGTCVISMVRVEVLLSGGRRYAGTPRQRQVQERSASSLGRPLRAKSSVLWCTTRYAVRTARPRLLRGLPCAVAHQLPCAAGTCAT